METERITMIKRTISSAALAGVLLAGALFCACTGKENTEPSGSATVTPAASVAGSSMPSDVSVIVTADSETVKATPTVTAAATPTPTVTPAPTAAPVLTGDNMTYTPNDAITDLRFCDSDGKEITADYDMSVKGISIVVTFEEPVDAASLCCDVYHNSKVAKKNVTIEQGSSPNVVTATFDKELTGGNYALVLTSSLNGTAVTTAYVTVYSSNDEEN